MPHQIIWIWYTGRWWVGCYIWYSEEGPGRAAVLMWLYNKGLSSILFYYKDVRRGPRTSKLQTFYMRCQWRVLDTTWSDFVRNTHLGQHVITTIVWQCRLILFGHRPSARFPYSIPVKADLTACNIIRQWQPAIPNFPLPIKHSLLLLQPRLRADYDGTKWRSVFAKYHTKCEKIYHQVVQYCAFNQR